MWAIHRYVGEKVFLKGRESGLFVNFLAPGSGAAFPIPDPGKPN
jgi:hypothetical protein